MHLFDDITLKPKCSEADLFKGLDGLSTAQWAATLVICWFTFGTALHCFGSHCTVWHLLSAADLPLGSSSCQMPSRTLTSDIPEIQSLCHQDCPDACKGAAQIERSVPGSSCSSDHHRDCSFPLLPVFQRILSTWTPAAYRWAFGTAHWGCAGSVGTCTGTSLCCWELPTRCRCCRRADSRSVLHKIVTIWRRGGELCKWNELGLVSCCKHKCKHIIIYTK